MTVSRARWAAIGAAIAVTLGGGGIGIANAMVEEGPKPVFVSITPCRLLDTRTVSNFNTGPRSTPIGMNETYTVKAAGGTNGDCNEIPATAVALVMNVTLTNPTANTFVTVFPSNVTRPNAANLNALAGDTRPIPNLVSTPLSPTGEFSIYNLDGTVNVVADVAGYYEDHNHDDRYYTEDESNSLFLTQVDMSVGTVLMAGQSRIGVLPTIGSGAVAEAVALDTPGPTFGTGITYSASEFTIADPGIYKASFNASVTAAFNGSLQVRVNGTPQGLPQLFTLGASVSDTQLIEVAAGDTVDLFINGSVLLPVTGEASFTITRVG